jgi:hypothetical protein
MKRSNNKDYKKHFNLFMSVGLIVLFILLLVFIKKKDQLKDNDFRLAVITDQNLEMVSISPQRTMVNVLKIKNTVPVWLPYGPGWYRVEQIKKVLDEKKDQKIDNSFFWYNFGYIPDKIIYSNNEEIWKKDSVLISNLGLMNWLKYKFNSGRMLYKQPGIIKDDLLTKNEMLDEEMSRDFADNRIINSDLTISVFNATSENGLASFISERLEWSGFSVVSSESVNTKIDNCLFIYGPKTKESFAWRTLNTIFDCKSEYSDGLNENEAELYFGDKYVSVVNYSNYKRNF